MAASRTLSELVIVREWLHDTAPPPPRPDASTGYWRFTKHRVTQGRWTGNTGRTVENVVREMDPDAVVREAEIGRSLAGDDAVRAFLLLSFFVLRPGKFAFFVLGFFLEL
jgi:nuclear pore complex protein Nup107